MSRSDDPAHWDDPNATPEQKAQRNAHSATPHGINPHSQPLATDPYSQTANQVPPGQAAENYYQPHQHVPGQPAAQQPVAGQPVAPQQYAQQPVSPQHVPQQPGGAYPAAGHPVPGQPVPGQPVPGQPGPGYPVQGQPADPYGQAIPQTTYTTQLDELASQIEASQAAAAPANQPPQNPHQDQTQYTGYAGQPDPYTQPAPYTQSDPYTQAVQPQADATSQFYNDPTAAPLAPQTPHTPAQPASEDLQSYYNQQPAPDGAGADSLSFQPTGYATAQPPQPTEYDLGGIMAPDPIPVTQAPTNDHFRASLDLPSQHSEVDFGQHNLNTQQPQTGDLGHLAEHFAEGPGGAVQSLEPGLQNDAEYYEKEYPEEDFDEYEDGPSKSGGFFKLVATLLMAVITGGGMAYGYKYYVASDGGKNTPAIIRADNKPAKMVPKDPGGKKFAHTGKAIFDRVGGPQKPQAAGYSLASGSSDDAIPGISLSGSQAPVVRPNNGTKKVRTVSVRPDGSYAPSQPLRPSKPVNVERLRQQTDSIAIPGITMAGAGLPRTATPSRTRVATRVSSENSAASVKKTLTDELVRKVGQPRPTPKKPPVRVARATPPQTAKSVAAVTTTRGTSPNGYVSQISSRKSRLDALSAFADLRQRYGSILSRSQPDIQEANLGSKGVWYRLRIGPPSSKRAAGELCNKLKTAGHKGCFVRAY